MTLNQQSGSGGSSSVTATYDAAMPSMGAIPTRQGYTFGGYYSAVDGGGTQYYTAAGASARTWNIAGNTTLYAKWNARSYTLKVNPNGGSHGSHTAEYTVGNLVTGASSYQGIGAATRSGYTLDGFYDASTGGTKVYDGNGRAVDGTYWNGNYGTPARFKGLADASATSLTVYARWTTNQYTVTLDRQSGSGGSSSVRATYDAAMPSMGAIPTRQGYTFGGYYSAMNGGGTQYYTAAGASARTWNIASNTTLYAKWNARSYALKVNPNGGSHDGHTAEYARGDLVTGRSSYQGIGAATRSGYTLAGFYDASTGGTKVYDGNGRAVDGTYWNGNYNTATFKGFANASVTSLTVHARWTANQYTVTLDRQSGSGGSSSVRVTYDAAMPTVTMPTRTGYAFGGYYTSANGGGTQYYTAAGASARKWNVPSNTTLYAKWTAKQYTLKVNPNGGSHDGHTAEYARGDLVTGRSSYQGIGAATCDGYTLDGFYDASTGGTKVYDGNGRAVDGTYWNGNYNTATFKGLANASATVLTVYARWTPNKYPVTFAIYGGTFLNGWTATTNYTLGVGLTLPTAADVSWVDHTFVGWYEDEAFLSDRVTKIGTSEMGNKTFYARWVGKTYTVSFNANGGVGQGTQLLSMTDTEQNQLKTLAELKIKVPDGYTFAAWNTTADGSGDSFEDGAVIYNNLTNVANATVTLYAQWTPNLYEVAFCPNGADGGETMAKQPFVYDVTQALEHVAFTYTGHAFREWSSDTNYNYQTTYYADEAAVANLATGGVVNLYANWTGIVYTVSFDANGGVGAMDPLICTYDVPTNLPACAFMRDGWGFKGWTTNGADDVVFADRARVTNLTTTAEVTLLACWTGVTYQVTLDARDSRGNGVLATNGMGEAVSVLTNSYVVGDAWDLPVPTNVNTHLSFAGWTYVDTNGVVNTLSESDVVPPPSVFGGTTNLMAAWGWVVDPLAAAVDAPDLEFSTFGTAGYYGVPTETRTNYNWFAQANFVYGSTNAVQSAELPVNTADSHVYVSWLTTTVETNGVLSFWWKCDAKPLIGASLQQYALKPGWCGNSFTFGLYDSAKGITNTIAQLTDHVDWCCVVYTNKSDSPVTFAWAFAYADYDERNGGGTGWVDRVTWTTNGSVSVEVTSPHKVPYSWLREKFPDYESASDGELETLAENDSPNGKPMKVWEEYWAGTNPNDLNDLFRANILVSNDVAHITWQPDLSVTGKPVRVYHVLSAPTPSAGWMVLQSNVEERLKVELPVTDDSGANTNRFFKVELDWEESQKKN